MLDKFPPHPSSLDAERWAHIQAESARRRKFAQDNRVPYETHRRGYIYVFQGAEYFKIGRSADVYARMKHLNVPFPLEIRAKVSVHDMCCSERRRHRLFREKRIRGEWFNLCLCGC